MTKMLRITRDFNYFEGTINSGYQELEVDKEYWESLKEYNKQVGKIYVKTNYS